MFNIKWGAIVGCTAFVLAFMISLLLGQTSLLIAFLRALGFAGLFFALVVGASVLIKTFIPDLLNPISTATDNEVGNFFTVDSPGSKVNITLDDAHGAAVPDSDEDSFDSGNVGDFNDLVTGKIHQTKKTDTEQEGDIDQNFTSSYTNDTEFAPSFDNTEDNDSGEFSVDFGAFVSDSEGSEGMEESFSDSFSFFSDENDSAKAEEASRNDRKTISRNKPTEFKGDFDPKEIAIGIRTVLEKDKKRG
jgi:hypothetical protein